MFTIVLKKHNKKIELPKKYTSLNYSLTILNCGKIATFVRGLLAAKKLFYNHTIVNICLLYENSPFTGFAWFII